MTRAHHSSDGLEALGRHQIVATRQLDHAEWAKPARAGADGDGGGGGGCVSSTFGGCVGGCEGGNGRGGCNVRIAPRVPNGESSASLWRGRWHVLNVPDADHSLGTALCRESGPMYEKVLSLLERLPASDTRELMRLRAARLSEERCEG